MRNSRLLAKVVFTVFGAWPRIRPGSNRSGRMDSFRMGVPWQQAADGVPAAPADPGLRAPGEGRCSACRPRYAHGRPSCISNRLGEQSDLSTNLVVAGLWEGEEERETWNNETRRLEIRKFGNEQ